MSRILNSYIHSRLDSIVVQGKHRNGSSTICQFHGGEFYQAKNFIIFHICIKLVEYIRLTFVICPQPYGLKV